MAPSPPPVEDRLSPPLNETSTENEKQRDSATGLDRAVEASNTVSEKDEGSDGSEEDLEDLHNQNRTLMRRVLHTQTYTGGSIWTVQALV